MGEETLTWMRRLFRADKLSDSASIMVLMPKIGTFVKAPGGAVLQVVSINSCEWWRCKNEMCVGVATERHGVVYFDASKLEPV